VRWAEFYVAPTAEVFPRIMSAAFSAIMIAGTLALAQTMVCMEEDQCVACGLRTYLLHRC
jgi:hypothetical protein